MMFSREATITGCLSGYAARKVWWQPREWVRSAANPTYLFGFVRGRDSGQCFFRNPTFETTITRCLSGYAARKVWRQPQEWVRSAANPTYEFGFARVEPLGSVFP